MENVTISATTTSAVIGALKAVSAADKQWVKVSDACKVEGITADTLAPKGQHREPMKLVVIGAFNKAQQELLAKAPATLSEGEKAERRELQQRIGRYLALIQQHLRPKSPKGASHRRSIEERLRDEWKAQIEAINKAQKSEGDLAFDADVVVKTLRELIADL
jgi:hypothetical protein